MKLSEIYAALQAQGLSENSAQIVVDQLWLEGIIDCATDEPDDDTEFTVPAWIMDGAK